MKIATYSTIEAGQVAAFLVQRGAGFTVHTREIFQTGPIIETGDDVEQAINDFCKMMHIRVDRMYSPPSAT